MQAKTGADRACLIDAASVMDGETMMPAIDRTADLTASRVIS